MARKPPKARKKRGAAGSDAKPGKGNKSRRSIGRAASIVILGGFLLTGGPAGADEYELPFISVMKKPPESVAEKNYQVAAAAAREGNNVPGAGEFDFSAGGAENYFDAMLLDLKAPHKDVAISSCGFCACAACACPDCAGASCGTACTPACGPACTPCNCALCTCLSCPCVKGACSCFCQCFCHCAACTACTGGICACFCASDCM